MIIDTEKITKAIKDEIEKGFKIVYRGNVGLAACCSICGSGSISTCPCAAIRRVLENPPKNCIIKK